MGKNTRHLASLGIGPKQMPVIISEEKPDQPRQLGEAGPQAGRSQRNSEFASEGGAAVSHGGRGTQSPGNAGGTV